MRIGLVRCKLDVFDRTLQPEVSATEYSRALACPGVDYVKVWPLPVVQPWWEDRQLNLLQG
jgi:hypothetical protein